MFSSPNPKLPGRRSRFYNFVRTITSGTDINATDLGDGVWQVSYVPKAPSVLSITQDYNDYQTTSTNQIAAYGHGKNNTSQDDSYIYTMLGYGDTAAQTIRVQISGQDAGTFVTTATGGFKIEMHATVRADPAVSDDVDITTCFMGCGLSQCQSFTNLRGNQLIISYAGGILIDPYFDAGLGNVEMTGFNAIYKPAGSV